MEPGRAVRVQGMRGKTKANRKYVCARRNCPFAIHQKPDMQISNILCVGILLRSLKEA